MFLHQLLGKFVLELLLLLSDVLLSRLVFEWDHMHGSVVWLGFDALCNELKKFRVDSILADFCQSWVPT